MIEEEGIQTSLNPGRWVARGIGVAKREMGG
jgi:hypothetical protein